MKLDRNLNMDGKGKYCLIKLRKTGVFDPDGKVFQALATLEAEGLLHWGNESPGDQFFVMKYKDRFTYEGLMGYAMAVKSFADKGMSENRMSPKEFDGWMEWHAEILREAEAAQRAPHQLPT